ncbi:MAG: hypothetical protein MI785_23575 [Kiloniellales bacterium]|nr:hypothetical protein [Kiloniellales bacterium]
MTQANEEVAKVLEQLKQLRDELALKIHLAGMEAKTEWEDLEKKWSDFEAKARFDETAEGLSGAVSLLADEIKAGYDRIRKAL